MTNSSESQYLTGWFWIIIIILSALLCLAVAQISIIKLYQQDLDQVKTEAVEVCLNQVQQRIVYEIATTGSVNMVINNQTLRLVPVR
jgi:flagellar basal body-associated protein FliL